jgi:hypothetical protein
LGYGDITTVEKSATSFVSGYTGPLGVSVIEGWYGSDHLILFNQAEIASASHRYAVSQFLPGYKVIGLRGWDDFILEDSIGARYCVPTVPAVAEHLSPYALPSARATLSTDDRFQGKIKWYVKPLVFGGDPESASNVIWVTHDQHAELVKYWNGVYRSLKSQ